MNNQEILKIAQSNGLVERYEDGQPIFNGAILVFARELLAASQSAEPVALTPSIAACIHGAEASGGAIDGRTAAKVFAAMVAADAVPTTSAATGAQGLTYERIKTLAAQHIGWIGVDSVPAQIMEFARAILAQAAPAQGALTADMRDRLVAISEAVADQDDRAAQAMLREILAGESND